jgi:Transglutaminase-like superfamily
MCYRRLKYHECIIFVEAWLALHWSKLMILFFPFQKIAARLGYPQKETPAEELNNSDVVLVAIGTARAVRYALYKSQCFDKSLAVMILLKRRKIPTTIYFGLKRDAGYLQAHAWLRCGNKIITGGLGQDEYAPVAWFGSGLEKGRGV